MVDKCVRLGREGGRCCVCRGVVYGRGVLRARQEIEEPAVKGVCRSEGRRGRTIVAV